MKRNYVIKATRQKQIAETGLSILTQEGIDNLTIRKVAAVLEIAPSAVYRHFSSKEEIIDTILSLIGENLQLALQEISNIQCDPMEQLEIILIKHVTYLVDRLGAGRNFVTTEIISRYPEKKSQIYANTKFLKKSVERILREAHRQGKLRKDIDSIQALANLYTGIYLTEIMQFQISGEHEDIQQKILATWKVYKQLITKEPANELHPETDTTG